MKLLHICESKCFIWQGGLWSAPSVHEAILRIMKHACRRMKRSLDRLHVFLPWNQGKKMGWMKGFEPSTSWATRKRSAASRSDCDGTLEKSEPEQLQRQPTIKPQEVRDSWRSSWISDERGRTTIFCRKFHFQGTKFLPFCFWCIIKYIDYK